MDIDLNSIKIFNEVAKCQNITKASENLFISQPAVSQSIKKLENYLGGNLFTRNSKGITLTKEGENFYSYTQKAINNIKTAKDEFDNFKFLSKGSIRIGSSTSLTKSILVLPIMNFHKDFPNINIEIVNGLTSELVTSLKQGDLDLIIYNDIDDKFGIETKTLKRSENCFIYNSNFFDFKDKIKIKDLESYPIIVQNSKSQSGFLFRKIRKENNIEKEPYMEVVSQELVHIFVMCGMGIGFTSKVYLEYLQQSNIKIIDLIEKIPEFEIKCGYISLQNMTFSAKKFLEYLL